METSKAALTSSAYWMFWVSLEREYLTYGDFVLEKPLLLFEVSFFSGLRCLARTQLSISEYSWGLMRGASLANMILCMAEGRGMYRLTPLAGEKRKSPGLGYYIRLPSSAGTCFGRFMRLLLVWANNNLIALAINHTLTTVLSTSVQTDKNSRSYHSA